MFLSLNGEFVIEFDDLYYSVLTYRTVWNYFRSIVFKYRDRM